MSNEVNQLPRAGRYQWRPGHSRQAPPPERIASQRYCECGKPISDKWEQCSDCALRAALDLCNRHGGISATVEQLTAKKPTAEQLAAVAMTLLYNGISRDRVTQVIGLIEQKIGVRR